MMIRNLFNGIKRLIPMVLYMTFYLLWFGYLERIVTTDYHLIHMSLDDYIPFIEAFIIPYEMWFFYVAATYIFLAFTDSEEYKKTCIFSCLGMTLFLLISTVYPNGHDLRLSQMPRDNLLTRLVVHLQQTDTPTNLFPSIHVYNAIAMNIGLHRGKALKDRKWIKTCSSILCVSIILSTVFIKQHSVFDVITAFLCVAVFYHLVYQTRFVDILANTYHKLFKNNTSNEQNEDEVTAS